MKTLKSTIALAMMSLFTFASCDEANDNITDGSADVIEITDLTNEEINEAIQNTSINYPITAISEDDGTEQITSDEELTTYNENNRRPRIQYPISATINGETVTINNKNELKKLVQDFKKKKRKRHLKFVFPITVINADGSTQVIEDKAAMKAYHQTLEKGTRPTFEFPISIETKDGVKEFASAEDLKAFVQEKKQNRKAKKRRPRVNFVFPISVTNSANETIEIADKEAMKAYKETLAEGEKPALVFPIQITKKDGTVIDVNNSEELRALIAKRSKRKTSSTTEE